MMEALTAPRPDGIGLPGDAVGPLVEITAHLNDAMWATRPSKGGEFVGTASHVVKVFREIAGTGTEGRT
jgi:hypothetical protein